MQDEFVLYCVTLYMISLQQVMLYICDQLKYHIPHHLAGYSELPQARGPLTMEFLNKNSLPSS